MAPLEAKSKIFKNERLQWMLRWMQSLATDSSYFDVMAFSLLAVEVLLLIFIINFVSYTEIDWRAYMQEVEGVLNGTLDYAHLKGDTGPLVYPAGFVYIFVMLYYVTNQGANIALAQWIFAALYLINLSLVLWIYRHLFKSGRYPPYLLLFLGCTAYRIHSIYVLRLFNDSIAMLFLYAAVCLFLHDKWSYGSIIYSLAVSVKMNVLLFAPGLLVIYLMYHGWLGTIKQLTICALVQIFLGAPFIISNPISYLNGAFNFGRVFFYKWTVNWRLLPEWIFTHRLFHALLLTLQLLVLLAFAVKHWTRSSGFKSLFNWKVVVKPSMQKVEIPWILFTSNLIGMVFSRSLHYQFYVWYFHTLPFLLWSAPLHSAVRVGLLLLLEWTWNVYPSTVLSSASLHLVHCILLGALYFRPTRKVKL